LLHRLDYETQGLLAAAKTQAAWDSLAAQQEAGEFVKEYEAFSAGPAEIMPGFPPPPSVPAAEAAGTGLIESAFRPWGRGRKAVRPLPADPSGTSGGALYRTDICSRRPVPVPVPPEAADRTVPDEAETAGQPGQPDQSLMSFRLRIARGFRHQIRCHLAWIGAPILNDPLYGGKPLPATGKGFLALRASGLFFRDPESGEGREYRADLFDNPVGYLTVLAVSRLTAAKRAFFSGNCSETEVSEQL
jgi:23S rRNA pseudouridine1911/1915/1917 synthase